MKALLILSLIVTTYIFYKIYTFSSTLSLHPTETGHLAIKSKFEVVKGEFEVGSGGSAICSCQCGSTSGSRELIGYSLTEVNLPPYEKHNIHFTHSCVRSLHVSFWHTKANLDHTHLRYFKDGILSRWTRKDDLVPYTVLHKGAISTTSCWRSVIVPSETSQRLPRRGRCRAHMAHSLFHTPKH